MGEKHEVFRFKNGKWEMGNGKWEMGNGKWEMGNGKWEMGDLTLDFLNFNCWWAEFLEQFGGE